jgi:hypothetical protein
MKHNSMNRLTCIIFGTITGIGTAPAAPLITLPLLLATLIYGIVGGAGGWLFHLFIKWIKKMILKRKNRGLDTTTYTNCPEE